MITFDLRMTAPNREPSIDVPALHTILEKEIEDINGELAKAKVGSTGG